MLSDVMTVDRLDSDYWSTRYLKLIDKLTAIPNIKLAELCSFSNGATPRGAHYLKAGIPFLRIQNIEKNRLELDDVVFIEEDTHNNLLRRSQLHPGDVLITITGRIGTASIVPDDMPEGNINQHIVRLRLKNKNINPYYLSAFLNSQAGLLQTEREAYGTTREALPYYCLERIIIPFASNDIQKYVEMKIRGAETANQDARDLLNEAKRKIEQMVPNGAKS
jgi:restriction endonuclease S subunit